MKFKYYLLNVLIMLFLISIIIGGMALLLSDLSFILTIPLTIIIAVFGFYGVSRLYSWIEKKYEDDRYGKN